ncbi:MAG TPA: YciI family protein [Candidatus Dormibacteraeota bacterium]|nr:YciI family protein [Candidatus Dormibacteraeota bacterium]
MKFLMLFMGLAGQPDATDDQTVAYNARWGEYMGSLAQGGKLVSGLPLQSSGKVVTRDGVGDLELKPVDIGGYQIIEAATVDEAIEIARGAPHVALGGTTVVRPCDETRAQPEG